MKKTLNINLNGRVFNIDEDAYELLENYLQNLKSYFRNEQDSAEIIRDFEARIEELFQERIRLGYNVISIEQVEIVIERMGKPEDFGDEDFKSENSNSSSNKAPINQGKPKKRFYRNTDEKILGGVCSGIAAYFGWDPLPVRIIFFILILLPIPFMLLTYLALWIFMPAAITASQKLEMRGEAVTLENIGKTVSETTAASSNNGGYLSSFFKFGLGCFGCLVGIPLIFALCIVFIALISLIFGFSGLLFFPLDFLGFDWNGITTIHPLASLIALTLVIGIPLFSIIYALFSSNKKAKPLSKTFRWSAFIVWIIALIVFIFSGIKINNELSSQYHNKWNIFCDNNIVSGSGIIADRTEDLPAFSQLKIDNNLVATVRVRKGDAPQILINGDDNIIEKINWKLKNDELILGIKDHINFQRSKLIITITAPEITGIRMSGANKVFIDNKLTADNFNIKVEGIGSFQADSLYVQNLTCNLEGVGKATLGGKAQKAFIRLEGAGKIDSFNLEVDSLTARLEGVGSIRSNPIVFLDASLDGVGKITYKNEPQTRRASMIGVGKVGKE